MQELPMAAIFALFDQSTQAIQQTLQRALIAAHHRQPRISHTLCIPWQFEQALDFHCQPFGIIRQPTPASRNCAAMSS